MRRFRRPARPRIWAAAIVTLMAAFAAGCNSSGQGSTASGGGGPLKVVAAENFWGSIASQLGGSRVRVQSIIVNPTTDPHSYEPTAQDARTMVGRSPRDRERRRLRQLGEQAAGSQSAEWAGRAERRRSARPEGGR